MGVDVMALPAEGSKEGETFKIADLQKSTLDGAANPKIGQVSTQTLFLESSDTVGANVSPSIDILNQFLLAWGKAVGWNEPIHVT